MCIVVTETGNARSACLLETEDDTDVDSPMILVALKASVLNVQYWQWKRENERESEKE